MNQKVVDVYNAMVVKFKEVIREHELGHNDYHALVDWMDALGKAGEIPLFMDVFFETHALQEMYKNVKGTEPTILGPYYLENAVEIKNPGVLPMRDDEQGDILYFTGTVTDVDGNPLANTKVDMWQADASGEYSGFAEELPEGIFRAVLFTDENGNFEVKTVVPGDYSIPTNGPTGKFLEWIDSHPIRPAHLHFLFKPQNGDKLISQVFFEGNPYLDNDVANGVRGTLITKLEKHDGADKGLDKEYYTAHLDFKLRLQDQPVYN
ncbi:catechol 1,2-dioxygenase [Sporosarcina luteola]|uniref:Catechol 1,2-dioxygenase n=1 Tax=Sporosarcina luteola TaxID=582850 RepID=A0A511Z6S8_9BACL|nr:dioxygenase [Sporosarcina luteola]GEN83157.1 catechol 1,2-dioxygenase [Sporosarcina luteola]